MCCLSLLIFSGKEWNSVHKKEIIDLSKYRIEKARDMMKDVIDTSELSVDQIADRIMNQRGNLEWHWNEWNPDSTASWFFRRADPEKLGDIPLPCWQDIQLMATPNKLILSLTWGTLYAGCLPDPWTITIISAVSVLLRGRFFSFCYGGGFSLANVLEIR